MENLVDFYKNKRVFITGHSGFKGRWLVKILEMFGAEVCGYSLENGDVRKLPHLKSAFDGFAPEIVFHLAAQPLVRESYANPVYTYETNVIGTVNLLDCIRLSDTVKSFLNVTTDKVYEETDDNIWGYREIDRLNGFEPYSNSKSCSELVTASYYRSFLKSKCISVSTARAGNVIGGGDTSKDRIIPDCLRAAVNGETIVLRNPNSVRPYQHVLEPLFAYLLITSSGVSDNFNVGPNDDSCVTTGELTDLFCNAWGGVSWEKTAEKGVREAGFLKLDNSKIKSELDFSPKWDIKTAVQKTVEWEKANLAGIDITESQIKEYFRL